MLRRKEFVLAQNRHLNREFPGKIVVKRRENACSEDLFQKLYLDFMTASRHRMRTGRRSCSCDAITAPRTARRIPTTLWSRASAPRPGHDSASSPISVSSTTTRNGVGNAPSCFTTGRETDRQLRLFPDDEHVDLPDDPDVVRISLKSVGWANPRPFGDVWLGLWLWRYLKLDEIVDRHIPQGKETISSRRHRGHRGDQSLVRTVQ